MRLWHIDLIDVLPRQQLVSQWRECLAIMKGWKENTLNHRLVNYVMNYDKKMFCKYVAFVLVELNKRKIKWQPSKYSEVIWFCSKDNNYKVPKLEDMENYPEHNERYLRECLYNLEEKATRGIVSKEEWQKIYKKYKDKFDLWKGE